MTQLDQSTSSVSFGVFNTLIMRLGADLSMNTGLVSLIAAEQHIQTGKRACDSGSIPGGTVAEIHRFRKSEEGHLFRGWLWTIVNNCIRDYYQSIRAEFDASDWVGRNAAIELTFPCDVGCGENAVV
ncbi:MAG: hypothetical protein R3C05_28175 [Pirellulaceae bacterium]